MKGILRKAKLWELRETTLCNQPATAQAPDFAALEAEMFRSAHNQRYACRHYLLTPGGPATSTTFAQCAPTKPTPETKIGYAP